MPCGRLLNQDQIANGISWVLVILQLSDAQKSDEKWRYFCHSEVLALEPVALISIAESQFCSMTLRRGSEEGLEGEGGPLRAQIRLEKEQGGEAWTAAPSVVPDLAFSK